MRNMSFAATVDQIAEDRDGAKDLTRRIGWPALQPGDHFMAVEKCMGLKKGQKQRKIRELVCVSNTVEPLIEIVYRPYRYRILDDAELVLASETAREGFPQLSPWQFVRMFSTINKCETKTPVHRIEFSRVI